MMQTPDSTNIQRMALTITSLQHVLAYRNIFIICFLNTGEIVNHNYPSHEEARHIDNFAFLIGQDNLAAIKALVKTSVTGEDGWKFYNRNLKLHLFRVQDALWHIEVGSQEEETDNNFPNPDFEKFYSLTATLTEFKELQDNGEMDALMDRIRHEHLPRIRHVKESITDPILIMCLDLIEGIVSSTVSDDGNLDASLYALLTPSEAQVAKFIKVGMSTKEIAKSLSVASKTVENHRNSLRAKLGITNKGINLRNYLISISG
ncbi:helix-turn-helix transcriptional regulator [Andreprevotia sp. IGB-42]|uniref:helix-turn-helix domain-containing protein n=1 Tax=Andreprevotia sp. IGB-42 TaxID=2497473 RepID=UPI0013580710|nr:helix-turn-helix transcriptional regulator [Andreprevotia sp. IGB-42]